MNKTTPEEAARLAKKHGATRHEGGGYTNLTLTSSQLAAFIDEVRGVDAEPFMHVYEFASPFGGTVWRDSPGTWNGNQPKRSLPLYTHPAPSQPAAPVELPVVGWLSGNEYRFTFSKPNSDPRAEPLVKLSDAQAAIEAARKSV